MPKTPASIQPGAPAHPGTPALPSSPAVVLTAGSLVVTELSASGEDAHHQQAASTLVGHLARAVVEFLQHRRGRAGLGRVVTGGVENELLEWRRLIDWSSATLVSMRGALVSDHAVEGSFIIVRRGRRQSFVCRIEHNGRRWTCVRLAPVGVLLPIRPE